MLVGFIESLPELVTCLSYAHLGTKDASVLPIMIGIGMIAVKYLVFLEQNIDRTSTITEPLMRDQPYRIQWTKMGNSVQYLIKNNSITNEDLGRIIL